MTVESFVVGMYDEPALTEHDGSGYGVQIDLTAEGGYALVDGPLHELANRVVPLEDVCPHLATGRLVDRLLSARDLTERIEALRQEVALAMTGARCLSPEVAWVHRQLRQEPNTKVAQLASELEWRPARLVDAFRREVGLPPKSVARLARFERAPDLYEKTGPVKRRNGLGGTRQIEPSHRGRAVKVGPEDRPEGIGAGGEGP